MGGVAILRHGGSMILCSLGPALRVSVGPMLLALLVQALLIALGMGGLVVEAGEGVSRVSGTPGGAMLGGLLSTLASLLAFSWAAIAWHRYVLREEAPGLLPSLRQDLVWPYVGRSFVIGIVTMLAALPMVVVVSLVAAPFLAGAGVRGSWPVSATIIGSVSILPVLILIGWVGTRLSLTLPARAVKRPMTFRESWAATAPASGAILAASLILALVSLALRLVYVFVIGPGLAADGLDLVVRWVLTMLGISILTTLYGHLVEGRPLDP